MIQKNTTFVVLINGTLEATRTPDLRLRRQLLYPTELRGHVSDNYIKQIKLSFQALIMQLIK